MRVYRLSKSKYANDFSGKGAELTGGRRNKAETRLSVSYVYFLFINYGIILALKVEYIVPSSFHFLFINGIDMNTIAKTNST